MSTSEQRPTTVPRRDVDDVIAAAAELHQAAEARREEATVAEIEAVAAELDIDPSLVVDAIAKVKADRAAEVLAEQRARSTRRAWLTRAGLALGAFALVTGLFAGVGSSRVSSANTRLRLTEVALHEVVERQAALAPQLVALAGGDAARLRERVAAVHDAEGAAAELRASEALHTAMAEVLGELPPPTSSFQEQQRLDLQNEVIGTWSRLEIASRQHTEAASDRAALDDAFTVTVARGLGWVDAAE